LGALQLRLPEEWRLAWNGDGFSKTKFTSRNPGGSPHAHCWCTQTPWLFSFPLSSVKQYACRMVPHFPMVFSKPDSIWVEEISHGQCSDCTETKVLSRKNADSEDGQEE
jgi:hypothetical protein